MSTLHTFPGGRDEPGFGKSLLVKAEERMQAEIEAVKAFNRLPRAIRAMSPQAQQVYRSESSNGDYFTTCFLGATLGGIGSGLYVAIVNEATHTTMSDNGLAKLLIIGGCTVLGAGIAALRRHDSIYRATESMETDVLRNQSVRHSQH